MKVFVVTSGYYSDYTIEKLFSNRPTAVAKSMFAEGASVTMVEKALMNTSKESK
jgi:hypothetical protein